MHLFYLLVLTPSPQHKCQVVGYPLPSTVFFSPNTRQCISFNPPRICPERSALLPGYARQCVGCTEWGMLKVALHNFS